MMRLFLTLSLLLLGPLATCFGQGTQQPKKNKPMAIRISPEGFRKQFDKDEDGFLTKREVPPFLAKGFSRLDQNSDNKLDLKEITVVVNYLKKNYGKKKGPSKEQRAQFLLKKILEQDTNKDGKIARKEAQGKLAAAFDRVDGNQDDVLDRKEIQMLVQRILSFQKGPGGFGPRSQGPPDFDALDLNADGRLTKQELQKTPFYQTFEQMDADNNDRLTRREFETFLKNRAKN